MNAILNNFYWSDVDWSAEQSPVEKYQQLIRWARHARGKNPTAFDQITEWILDDSEWTQDKLAGNEQALMRGLIGRFREQTALFREWLKELEPHGVVNDAVWDTLDTFENALNGKVNKHLSEPVTKLFADFSVMLDRDIRKQIAGNKTGAEGVDTVEIYGYVNHLKDYDASVQWALFMPQVVMDQQNGFKVVSFEYKTMPAMRFIGREDDWQLDTHRALFQVLDGLGEYKSGFDYDILLMHHYGKGVDVGAWHGFWGRFFKEDTPVPDGFVSFDFIPHFDDTPGLPFGSQFAFAIFEGDNDAIHKEEGYDVSAMYDVTRNTMLGQNAMIPYPAKYWYAEVFLNGHENPSTAYLFSADF
ncbi:MAG: hypothetical protein LBK46_00095 [Oscillospiraceae bacterium]|jgi:hypothetical protein|nr:hypothetical protein [Oscillospiraceae bacterium]